VQSTTRWIKNASTSATPNSWGCFFILEIDAWFDPIQISLFGFIEIFF
jgi:hypothetical protein